MTVATLLLIGTGAGAGAATVAAGAAGVIVWMLPSLNPASLISFTTESSDWPTKSGITYASGVAGAATSRLIFGEVTPVALGGGSWAITVSGSASGKLMNATVPRSKPRRRM